ncbi:hypothetical protein [Sanguibacter sp. HDW7]|uniref:hypothetical protein n=1 Tax=Sanguibacter sp. HDW7 TaxID=2714931 RepID=UPI00140C2B9A|nr:hypothetical protein [Sanguibacter sp. HDW7]QIK84350.1 hypothetical protein G7063_12520 [Sanguibacter sp. HDW7]
MLRATDPRRARRVVAALVALAGVVGLSLASATWLDLPWGTGSLQQGSVRATAGCQDRDAVVVAYGAPVVAAVGEDPWRVATVEFAGIAEACAGRTYEVAYSTDGSESWKRFGTVGVVSGSSLTVSLEGVGNPEAITGWSLRIY